MTDEIGDRIEAISVQLEALAFRMECRLEAAGPSIAISPSFGRELANALRSGQEITAALTAGVEKAEQFRDQVLGPESRSIWPLEVRDAVDVLEAQYDIHLVSSEHAAGWVERCNAAEARAETAEAGLARAVEVIMPFANAWEKLRDPLPDGPFAIPVDASACAAARRFLATHPAPTQEPKE